MDKLDKAAREAIESGDEQNGDNITADLRLDELEKESIDNK